MVLSAAPPLGLIENSSFVETTIDLGPGDGFLLHTDGLYGPAKTGVERSTPAQLQNLLSKESSSAQALLERILARAVPASGEPLADDLAALLVRRCLEGPIKNFFAGEKLILLSSQPND